MIDYPCCQKVARIFLFKEVIKMVCQVYVLLFALVIIDYALGVAGAVINKTFSSTVMREGLVHKATYVVAIVVAELVVMLSGYLDLGYVYVGSMVALVCVWIALTEIGSILENLVKINPELSDNKFMQIFTNDKNEDK